ncbi:hypothetical protein AAF712_016486 [Marasmius tenuissimus]|uniref:Uncharacterized protein n=1 Tax=Marasmius tenuissimus TaxID=585030 RepID=A0ABR2Z6M3_9AGAR
MFVPSSRQSTTTDFIRSRLKEKRIGKSTITRQIVLEKVIGLLAHNRRYAEAPKVYKQMVEEKYNPSPIVDAQMLVVGLAWGVAKPEKAMDGSRGFSRLEALELPPRLIFYTIQNSFPAEEGTTSHLQSSLTSCDQTDICSKDADVSIEIDTDADTDSTASSRTQPYATLISSLTSFDPLSQGTIDRVLRTIRYNEIRIDSALFSALNFHFASSRDAKKTMALYDALKKARRGIGSSSCGQIPQCTAAYGIRSHGISCNTA